jgi:hypothetical protein
MKNKALLMAQALSKLTLLDTEAGLVKNDKVYAQLQKLGLSRKNVSKLRELIATVNRVGNRVSTIVNRVGNRVSTIKENTILKIIEFVKAYPVLVAVNIVIVVVIGFVTIQISSINAWVLFPIVIMLGIAAAIFLNIRLSR